jgi:hypothetical protein
LAILAEIPRAGNGVIAILGHRRYGVSTIQAEAMMGGRTLKDMIRGDVPLARAIFNDERKRRLIQQLQQDGWPIFDLAGKRCAFPADLAAHARKATRRGLAQKKRGAVRRPSRARKADYTASPT